jgi:hypothetical protein
MACSEFLSAGSIVPVDSWTAARHYLKIGNGSPCLHSCSLGLPGGLITISPKSKRETMLIRRMEFDFG